MHIIHKDIPAICLKSRSRMRRESPSQPKQVTKMRLYYQSIRTFSACSRQFKGKTTESFFSTLSPDTPGRRPNSLHALSDSPFLCYHSLKTTPRNLTKLQKSVSKKQHSVRCTMFLTRWAGLHCLYIAGTTTHSLAAHPQESLRTDRLPAQSAWRRKNAGISR